MKIPLLLYSVFILAACGGDHSSTGTPSGRKKELMSQYPEVPDPQFYLKDPRAQTVYKILESRYSLHLRSLKAMSDSLGAKLVMVVLTPEAGEAVTVNTQQGIPFLLTEAQKNNIDAFDLTPVLQKYKPTEITQMPKDGHWNAAGADIIAQELSKIVSVYSDHRSPVALPEAERPGIMGDLKPKANEILDGGKDLPYNLITNGQGFRMNSDLSFPKKKQRVLLFGDSQLYSPFLDNDKISTHLLQQKHPDKEIINAAVTGYTVDDHVTLLKEKAKYAEPDLIILVTNPNDITDMYFGQRNRLGRDPKGYEPAREEIDLYHVLHPKK